jgi:hypothetical protein
VIALANKAIDATRRWAWNIHRTLESDRAKWVKATRWALVKRPRQLNGLAASSHGRSQATATTEA